MMLEDSLFIFFKLFKRLYIYCMKVEIVILFDILRFFYLFSVFMILVIICIKYIFISVFYVIIWLIVFRIYYFIIFVKDSLRKFIVFVFFVCKEIYVFGVLIV